MQGETLSSILCTNTMDRMSVECTQTAYKYKNAVLIPKSGFVDDLVDIQKCGQPTKDMNTYTNEEINKRKLQCATDKCKRMHFGKKTKCEDLHIDSWGVKKNEHEAKIQLIDVHQGKVLITTVSSHLNLGEVVSSDGKNKLNLDKRTSRGQGIIRDINHILDRVYVGDFYFTAAILLRNALLLSVLINQCEIWYM